MADIEMHEIKAEALGQPFAEGDDLHSPESRAKMAAGIPLEDADRWPWLDRVGEALSRHEGIIACSALKRAYRDTLYAAHPAVRYVLIHITPELATARAQARAGHFWPASLTLSQFAILEEPAADEPSMRVDATWATDQQVAAVQGFLR